MRFVIIFILLGFTLVSCQQEEFFEKNASILSAKSVSGIEDCNLDEYTDFLDSEKEEMCLAAPQCQVSYTPDHQYIECIPIAEPQPEPEPEDPPVIEDPEEFLCNGLEDEGDDLENANKVYVCHFPPGNPDNAHTICIGYPGWINGHSRHYDEDYLGPCEGADL